MRTRWTFAWLCVAWLFPQIADAQTEVSDRVTASLNAAGGYEALASVASVKRTGRVVLTIVGQRLEGDVETVIVPWRKAHQLIDVGIERRIQAWDGRVAWEDSLRNGGRHLEGPDAAGIRLQSVLHPLLGYQMLTLLGAQMERIDSKRWNERDHDGVRIAFEDGFELRVYLDSETSLVGWVEMDVPIPQLGLTATLRMEYSDYAEFEGILLPQKERVRLGDLFDMTLAYDAIEVGGPVDDALFRFE